MFWPFLIYYLSKKNIKISIIAIIAISILVRIYLTKSHFDVYYFTFSRMDELALGAWLAILEADKKFGKNSSTWFLLLFILVMIPTCLIWMVYAGSRNELLQVFKFNLISLAYFSFIGFVITTAKSNLFKRVFKTGILSYTGKISYGLYVYHPLCFSLFSQAFKINSILLSLVGSFASAYILSSLSFYLFESKFLKLKKYFEYKKVVPAAINLEAA